MAARTTMQPIIAELRRRVFDVGPEDLDDDVQYAGDTVRLTSTFYDFSSNAANPTTPTISIWDASGNLLIDAASTVSTGATGVQTYDYAFAGTGPEGTWRTQFSGTVSSATRRYTKEFEVRITQRIWSDDNLQRHLDRYVEYVGDTVAGREKLRHNPAYTTYISKFTSLEWATLYDSNLQTATEYTPDSTNLQSGKFTFTTAQTINLYLEGEYHNIYAAAADCLMELVADPSRAFRWSRGGVSQESVSLLDLLKEYKVNAHGVKSIKTARVYGG